jgi:hypothetical protein
MKQPWWWAVLLLGWAFPVAAAPVGPQDLVLKANDVRVVPRDDGLHLIVRQIPGLASVMVTESYELSDHKLATYSWRGLASNPVNGAEKRLLDGKFLPQPNLFLISSTLIADPLFGPAFEILIPPVIEYGSKTLPNSRYGSLDVTAELAKPHGKVWLSLRTFAKPYGDYTGTYQQNAFELSTVVVEQVLTLPLDGSYYVKGNEDLFRRLGTISKSYDAAAGVAHLKTFFQDNTDLVILLDLTKSMTVDLKALRADLLPGLPETVAGLKNFRLGFVEYRDYGEPWYTKPFALSADPSTWISEVNAAEARGGGDIPEAVVEALDAGVALFDRSASANPAVKKVVVVFGDAPQHDSPRGRINESEVLARAKTQGIEIQTILLPVTPF